MNEDPPSDLSERIHSRIRDEPIGYISRDRHLDEKYLDGSESDSEPVKTIQKEIDGMARLLRTLADDENVQVSTTQLIELYEQEIEELRQLEEGVIKELPKRHR